MALALSPDTVERLTGLVGAETGVPARLLEALSFRESSHIPTKLGRAGEVGLMQVKPTTAAEVGITGDLFDPLNNARAGARYLAKQFARFGTWGLALAAYNAGPGNVAAGYRGNLQSYVRPILERAGYFTSKGPESAAWAAWLPKLAFAFLALSVMLGGGRGKLT